MEENVFSLRVDHKTGHVSGVTDQNVVIAIESQNYSVFKNLNVVSSAKSI